MLPRRVLLAALVLLGLSAAVLEDALIHTDDGCILETHCNACLLKLATHGVTTEPFTVPQGAAPVERVAVGLRPALPEEAPRRVSSRGRSPRL
jgi:hypothetical protein